MGWAGVIPERVAREEVGEAVGAMEVAVLGVGARGVEHWEGEVMKVGVKVEVAKVAAVGEVAWTVAVLGVAAATATGAPGVEESAEAVMVAVAMAEGVMEVASLEAVEMAVAAVVTTGMAVEQLAAEVTAVEC